MGNLIRWEREDSGGYTIGYLGEEKFFCISKYYRPGLYSIATFNPCDSNPCPVSTSDTEYASVSKAKQASELMLAEWLKSAGLQPIPKGGVNHPVLKERGFKDYAERSSISFPG